VTARASDDVAPVALPPEADAFLDHLARQRRLSPHTIAAYRRDLAKLASLLPAPGAGRETPPDAADIRRAASRLHAAGQAPASIARALSAWRSFFRWRAEQGLGDLNPAAGTRPPRRAQRLPKALAPDTAVRLAAHVADDSPLALRDHALIELLYSSGLRLAELVSLDRRYFEAEGSLPRSTSWIDLEAAEVMVRGKGNKSRIVPVGRSALEAIRAWLAARERLPARDDRALFVSELGTRIAPRSVQQRVTLRARQLGLDEHVHPHVLRHSMASHVLQSSGDLRAVQELLGHANIATTQIYTRLDWQHLAKAYDAAHPRARRKTR
jgi:integrase/recombinase XerC